MSKQYEYAIHGNRNFILKWIVENHKQAKRLREQNVIFSHWSGKNSKGQYPAVWLHRKWVFSETVGVAANFWENHQPVCINIKMTHSLLPYSPNLRTSYTNKGTNILGYMQKSVYCGTAYSDRKSWHRRMAE